MPASAAAAKTAAAFAGIHNENEFYSHHYLSEVFAGDIRETVERWREVAAKDSRGAGDGQTAGDSRTASDSPTATSRTPYGELHALATEYVRFRREFERERRADRRLSLQRAWFRRLLTALGYGGDWQPGNRLLEDGAEAPVLCAAGFTAGAGSTRPAATRLLVLGVFDAHAEGEDPLSLKRQYEADTWYDTNGRIVFTASKGLPGVGLPRKAVKGDTSYTLRIPNPGHAAPSGIFGAAHNAQEATSATVQTGIALGWEDIRDLPAGGVVTRRITDDTLPGGPIPREIVYHPPFDRCHRELDYRTAWAALGTIEDKLVR